MRRLLLAAMALALTRADGLQLAASGATLRITLPRATIEVLFPEHVTALRHGATEAEHLYMSTTGSAPVWRRSASALEYERDLPHDIHMLARATLQDDGVLFHYEF